MELNFVSQPVLQETSQSKIFHKNKERIFHTHMNVSYSYLTDPPSCFEIAQEETMLLSDVMYLRVCAHQTTLMSNTTHGKLF